MIWLFMISILFFGTLSIFAQYPPGKAAFQTITIILSFGGAIYIMSGGS